MNQDRKTNIQVRIISICFVVLALAVFMPFGLSAGEWTTYLHLAAFGLIGICVCVVTELLLQYALRKPLAFDKGVDYIIWRNLWFQLINSPLVALGICLYRHYVMSGRMDDNRLSWGNYLATLMIIVFCSFVIGLYWRFRFRSRYMAAELEESRKLNQQLQKLYLQEADPQNTKSPAAPQSATTVTLTGSTSERVSLRVADLLYVESVGNYAKVCYLLNNEVHTVMLRTTLHQTEEQLQGCALVTRCHRAFLVNMGQVERIVTREGHMQLIMKQCHDVIPVSRSHMAHIKGSVFVGL